MFILENDFVYVYKVVGKATNHEFVLQILYTANEDVRFDTMTIGGIYQLILSGEWRLIYADGDMMTVYSGEQAMEFFQNLK